MSIYFYFRTPFADSGDKTAVPHNTQPSGDVSFEEGWTADYELDLGVDPSAKAIDRQKHNYLFNLLMGAVGQLQEFGTPEFIEAADNGGVAFSYSQYARVVRSGVVYESLTNGNTDTPPSANWQQVVSGVLVGKDDLAAQSLVNNTTLTFPHTLGVDPTLISIKAECTTNDGDYTVGDKIDLSASCSDSSVGGRGYTIEYDASNVYLHIATNGIPAVGKVPANLPFALTAGSWDISGVVIS